MLRPNRPIAPAKSADDLEALAAKPRALDPEGFNSKAELPYGLSIAHVRSSMQEFIDFLGLINESLVARSLPRLESFLMPANFSSIVGEFMTTTIPKHCPTIAKNTYHNGYPDLLPKGVYANDSQLHAEHGFEVKGSRYWKGWQGHNLEACWLLVFVFASNRPTDHGKGVLPQPFSFIKVVGEKLETSDWQFAGRTSTSRRTITATVLPSGFQKMESNWIYRDSQLDRDASRFN